MIFYLYKNAISFEIEGTLHWLKLNMCFVTTGITFVNVLSSVEVGFINNTITNKELCSWSTKCIVLQEMQQNVNYKGKLELIYGF